MWVVLCESTDHAALWAYAGLRERGLAPLTLASPQALMCSTNLSHSIADGTAGFEIHMPDGATLASRDIRGLLNRIAATPTEHLRFASDSEARYAAGEVDALMLSLLASLGPAAVNRPSPRGLGGACRTPAEWALLAARCGLPSAPMRLSSHGTPAAPAPLARYSIVVLGTRVFGADLPGEIARACVGLAELTATELLGIELHLDRAQRLVFGSATALPDLRVAGRTFLDALHHRFASAPAGVA